jgi:rRNA processing protein Gar1
MVSKSPRRIGKCSVKAQGKILVNLDGINLPKIGSKAFIYKNGKHKPIGEVMEAIGSTQNPWVVISAHKSAFNIVQENEDIFTQESSSTKKSRKFKKKRKASRQRKI